MICDSYSDACSLENLIHAVIQSFEDIGPGCLTMTALLRMAFL